MSRSPCYSRTKIAKLPVVPGKAEPRQPACRAALVAQRGNPEKAIVFDDAYGVLTEMDLALVADEVFQLMDQQEALGTNPSVRIERRGR